MLTQQNLKEILNYNTFTGIFTWVNAEHPRHILNGKKAGYVKNGYISIKINKKSYMAHRLAWLYVYGKFPDNQIDHINGIKTDNRIENLRDVTCAINRQNLKQHISTNKSKMLGVTYLKRCNKYQSCIGINKKIIYLGLYETAEQAHEAYLTAKRKLHKGNTL